MKFENINFNTLRFIGDQFIFNKDVKELLISTATKSNNRTSRICLHSSTRESTQNMIICILENQAFDAHRHPKGKSESYTILEGTLYVDKYNYKHQLINSLKITSETSPYLHIGGQIHRPYTKDQICIYQEIYHGSFDKLNDVEYVELTS